MVLDGPKPLKSIEKQTLFLILGHSKKRYQRELHKSCFWIQNGDMGVPGSTYRLIFDVLLRCHKIIIFGRLPDGPKNRKNRALERHGHPPGAKRDDPQDPRPPLPPPHYRKQSLAVSESSSLSLIRV